MVDSPAIQGISDPVVRPVDSSSLTGTKTLGKDDFLKLLIVQLQHQDPLNPLDQNQFLAQTAQFSSLEQLQDINKQLTALATANTSPNLGQAASMLGKTVQVGTGTAQLSGKAGVSLPFSVDGQAADVQVQILDQQGNVVRTLSTGPLASGARSATWDGLDGNGQLMAPGTYSYRVAAVGTTGTAAPTAWVTQGAVTGLKTQGGQLVYQVGSTLVNQSDIVSIR